MIYINLARLARLRTERESMSARDWSWDWVSFELCQFAFVCVTVKNRRIAAWDLCRSAVTCTAVKDRTKEDCAWGELVVVNFPNMSCMLSYSYRFPNILRILPSFLKSCGWCKVFQCCHNASCLYIGRKPSKKALPSPDSNQINLTVKSFFLP